MIELTPIEETRCGKELIEIGFKRGLKLGAKEAGMEMGIKRVVLAQLERKFGGEWDSPRQVHVESPPRKKSKRAALSLEQKELIEIGFTKGVKKGIRKGILAQLGWLCGGELDGSRRARVKSLPLEKTADLALALLKFRAAADLDAWLSDHA